MHCKICGRQDARIRLCELKTAQIINRAHVDCDGHSIYRYVTEAEIDAAIGEHVRHGSAPGDYSALIKECTRVVKYLREIGEQTRDESTLPSADYADAMADSLEHALKQNDNDQARFSSEAR